MFGQSVRATSDEMSRSLPGDDLISQPIGWFTYAITIRRPARDVWPWLAQMGAGNRAGWYSYDLLDNGRRPSAEHILPELQQLSRGMIFPAVPGAREAFSLVEFEAERFLVLGSLAPSGALLMTWAFVLQETGQEATRLIVRTRAGPGYDFHGLPWWFGKRVLAVIHLIMQRKQLHGIAKRASLSFVGTDGRSDGNGSTA
jgi:hypothetical protein